MTVPGLERGAGDQRGDPEGMGRFPRWVGARFHAIGFWASIALPAVYLPLLLFGINDTEGLLVFLALFGSHVVALLAGRNYRRSAAEGGSSP